MHPFISSSKKTLMQDSVIFRTCKSHSKGGQILSEGVLHTLIHRHYFQCKKITLAKSYVRTLTLHRKKNYSNRNTINNRPWPVGYTRKGAVSKLSKIYREFEPGQTHIVGDSYLLSLGDLQTLTPNTYASMQITNPKY